MGSPITQIQSPQTNQPAGKGTFGQSQTGSPSQGIINEYGQLQPQNIPAQTQQSDGISRPMGKNGAITYPSQNGQPRMGQPNRYSNTVGPWDNSTIGRQSAVGKGKGA